MFVTAFLPVAIAAVASENPFYKISGIPDGGSVITALRDGEETVIGITDSPLPDSASIPDGLKAIFPSLSDESIPSPKRQAHEWPEWPEWNPYCIDPIGPLLSTKWGQGWPYNEMTPEIDGKHTLAGCTAVALAQILRYYEAPRDFGGVTGPVNNNPCQWWTLTPTTFNFDLMLDSYPVADDGSVPQESIDAVARLMYYCAQSVSTGYGLDESSALDTYLRVAFSEVFGYGPVLSGSRTDRYNVKHDSSGEGWFNLILDMLQEHGPIIFEGSSKRSGNHFFIVDGYKEKYLFHFNFGWGGVFDGFYDIRRMASDDFDFSNDVLMFYGFVPPSQSGVDAVGLDRPQTASPGEGVSVYSLSGRLLATAQDKSTACANLSPGIYILQDEHGTSKLAIR